MLLYEERLSRPQRRGVLDLNRYGKKIERIMDGAPASLTVKARGT